MSNEEIKIGVIGHPVSHSKSPAIHNYWLGKHGIDGAYEAFDVAPDNLAGKVKSLQEEGYKGVNLTVPHKETGMALCDELSETAKAVGAVNLMVFREDGTIYGDNTDVYGFIANLDAHKPDFDYKNCVAFVMGAGGAARAAVYALLRKNIGTIKICNRTDEKAEKLIADMKPYASDNSEMELVSWRGSENHLVNVGLLVNATPLGLKGQPAMVLNLFCLQGPAVGYDMVYDPLMTDFLCDLEARGEDIVTGIGMLLHQAAPSFESWTGVTPVIDEELEALVAP